MLFATNLTGTELVAAVLAGRMTVQEIASQLLSRIDETRSINAFISIDAENVQAQARLLDSKLKEGRKLALHGLPLIVKDNIDAVGYVTTCGTRAFRDNRPAHNAVALQKLLDSGAFVLGKANLHELAGGVTSNNAHFGPVHNPYDATMIAGGSSGGTAAAVAARMGPVGLATDTGGSARIPASLCGICGFRPSTGRYSTDGVLVLSHTRDTIGMMARSVADIAMLDEVVTGTSAHSEVDVSGLCIAIPRVPFFADVQGSVASAIEETMRSLSSHGVRFIEVDFTEISALHDECGDAIVLAEVRAGLEKYMQCHGLANNVERLINEVATPQLRERLAVILHTKPDFEKYRQLLELSRPRLQQAYRQHFASTGVDAIIYPTTVLTARPIGDDDEVWLNGRRVPTFSAYCRNTDQSSNAGLPSLSIPIGVSAESLPIGLSLDGPHGGDARLLRIGRAIQELCAPMNPPPM